MFSSNTRCVTTMKNKSIPDRKLFIINLHLVLVIDGIRRGGSYGVPAS
jgi:hypothetical protein